MCSDAGKAREKSNFIDLSHVEAKMRRRVTVRCCVLGLGVPLSLWITINVLNWNFKPSSDWFAPNPNAGRLHIRAKKVHGSKRSQNQRLASDNVYSDDKQKGHNSNNGGGGLTFDGNSGAENSEVCAEIVDTLNKDVAYVYNVSLLNRQGIIMTPQHQKMRDEGMGVCHSVREKLSAHQHRITQNHSKSLKNHIGVGVYIIRSSEWAWERGFEGNKPFPF